MVAIVIVIIAAAIAAGVKTLIQGSLGGLSYGKTLANLASIFIPRLGSVWVVDRRAGFVTGMSAAATGSTQAAPG